MLAKFGFSGQANNTQKFLFFYPINQKIVAFNNGLVYHTNRAYIRAYGGIGRRASFRY